MKAVTKLFFKFFLYTGIPFGIFMFLFFYILDTPPDSCTQCCCDRNPVMTGCLALLSGLLFGSFMAVFGVISQKKV